MALGALRRPSHRPLGTQARSSASRRAHAALQPPGSLLRPQIAQAQTRNGAGDCALWWLIVRVALFCWAVRGEGRGGERWGWSLGADESDHKDEDVFPLSLMTKYNPLF